MTTKPLVTVCIASYNHDRYLGAALDSVLAQSRRDLEVVVVDDGSRDGSVQLLEAYAARHPQVRFFTHPGGLNRGISASFNRAIQESRGTYLAWLGSDDIWDADKLAQQVPLLEDDPALGLVYGLARVIDADGASTGRIIGADLPGGQAPAEALLRACVLPCLTVVLRRSCLNERPWFDERLVYSDWEMWIRIAADRKVRFIDRPLASYRIHGSNASLAIDSGLDARRRRLVMEILLEKAATAAGGLASPAFRALIQDRVREITREAAQAYFDQFYDACRDGRPQEGLQSLGEAFKLCPVEALAPRRVASLVKHALLGQLRGSRSAAR